MDINRKAVGSGGTGDTVVGQENPSLEGTGRLNRLFWHTVPRYNSLRERSGTVYGTVRGFGIFEDRMVLSSKGLVYRRQKQVLKVGLEPTQSFPHMPLNFF